MISWPERILPGIVDPDLDQVAVWRHACPGEMAGHRLGHLHLRCLAVGDLDRVVTIALGGLDLDDATGSGLDDGDRNRLRIVVEDLRHAQLLAEDRFHVLISTSTPAGRSSRMSESTVFGVGSRMSMRRLWMRISKCSRESL